MGTMGIGRRGGAVPIPSSFMRRNRNIVSLNDLRGNVHNRQNINPFGTSQRGQLTTSNTRRGTNRVMGRVIPSGTAFRRTDSRPESQSRRSLNPDSNDSGIDRRQLSRLRNAFSYLLRTGQLPRGVSIRMDNGIPVMTRINPSEQARHSFSQPQVRNILRNINIRLNSNRERRPIRANLRVNNNEQRSVAVQAQAHDHRNQNELLQVRQNLRVNTNEQRPVAVQIQVQDRMNPNEVRQVRQNSRVNNNEHVPVSRERNVNTRNGGSASSNIVRVIDEQSFNSPRSSASQNAQQLSTRNLSRTQTRGLVQDRGTRDSTRPTVLFKASFTPSNNDQSPGVDQRTDQLKTRQIVVHRTPASRLNSIPSTQDSWDNIVKTEMVSTDDMSILRHELEIEKTKLDDIKRKEDMFNSNIIPHQVGFQTPKNVQLLADISLLQEMLKDSGQSVHNIPLHHSIHVATPLDQSATNANSQGHQRGSNSHGQLNRITASIDSNQLKFAAQDALVNDIAASISFNPEQPVAQEALLRNNVASVQSHQIQADAQSALVHEIASSIPNNQIQTVSQDSLLNNIAVPIHNQQMQTVPQDSLLNNIDVLIHSQQIQAVAQDTLVSDIAASIHNEQMQASAQGALFNDIAASIHNNQMQAGPHDTLINNIAAPVRNDKIHIPSSQMNTEQQSLLNQLLLPTIRDVPSNTHLQAQHMGNTQNTEVRPLVGHIPIDSNLNAQHVGNNQHGTARPIGTPINTHIIDNSHHIRTAPFTRNAPINQVFHMRHIPNMHSNFGIGHFANSQIPFGHRLPPEMLQELMFGDTTDPPDPTEPPVTTLAPTVTTPSAITTTTHEVIPSTENPVIKRRHHVINNTDALNNFLSSVKKGKNSGFKFLVQLPGSNTTIPVDVNSVNKKQVQTETKQQKGPEKEPIINNIIKLHPMQQMQLHHSIKGDPQVNPNGLHTKQIEQVPIYSHLSRPNSSQAENEVKVSSRPAKQVESLKTIESAIQKPHLLLPDTHLTDKFFTSGQRHLHQNKNTIQQNMNSNSMQQQKDRKLNDLSRINSDGEKKHNTQNPLQEMISAITNEIQKHQNVQSRVIPYTNGQNTGLPALNHNTGQHSTMSIKPPQVVHDQNAQLIQNRLHRIENLMNKLMLTTTTTPVPVTTPYIEPDEYEEEELPVTPKPIPTEHVKQVHVDVHHHGQSSMNHMHHNNQHMSQQHGSNNHNRVFEHVTPSAPDITHQCNPHLPNFGCEGIGMFQSIKSISAWCVGKCVQGHCVESVCQCGCYINSKVPNNIHKIGNEIASAITGSATHSTDTSKTLNDLYSSLNTNPTNNGFALSLVDTPLSHKPKTTAPPSDVKTLLASIEQLIESKLSHRIRQESHSTNMQPRSHSTNIMQNAHESQQINSGGKNGWPSTVVFRTTPANWRHQPPVNQWKNNGQSQNTQTTNRSWQRSSMQRTTTPVSWSFQGRRHWHNSPVSQQNPSER